MADGPVETVHVPDEPKPREDGATQHVPDGPLAKPTTPSTVRFGRFQTVAELGAGAMGKVYRAYDDVLGRDVAIKVLQANDGSLRERFLREAKAIGAVTHPNILAVYDAAIDHEVPYLVMELAHGSLRDRLSATPLTADLVRQIGIQIAHGLAAAHAANILHRDVKPGNILVSPAGVWKLADFGIARMPDSTLTATGHFLGSPSYAAPESLRAAEFSAAADVYGLGVTLYEALTGAPPHGYEHASIMRKLDVDAAPLPASVPAAMARAIMAALARDPSRRPSAAQLAQLLAAGDTPQVAQAASAAAPANAVRATPQSSSHGTLVIIALATAAIATVLVGYAIWQMMAVAPEIEQAITGRPSTSPEEPVTTPQPPAAPDGVASALVGCNHFESSDDKGKASAMWSGCPDGIVRKIDCRKFIDDLKCDCLENGVSRWFFHIDRPDFSTAEQAGRLARTECRMGFGNSPRL